MISVGFVLFTLTMPSHSEADMIVTKAVDTPRPAPGNPVEFTVTIANDSPNTATGIEVTDRLPSGLTIPVGAVPFVSQGHYDAVSGVWETGSLQPLETAILTIPALPDPATSPTCQVNLARITSPLANDPESTNDWSIAAVHSGGSTDCARLTLVSSLQQAPRTGSPTVVLNVEIWNDGPDTAKGLGVKLSGVENVGNLDRDSYYGDLPAAHVLNSTASWTYDCGLSAFTESYTLTVYTETTAASDSVVSASGEISVPATAPCGGIEGQIEEGLSDAVCFVATAAYGSHLDSHVIALREFRDDYLMTNAVGRKFVDVYYRYSPPIASVIAKHEVLRFVTRFLLAPIIYAVSFPLVFVSVLYGLTLASLVSFMRRRGTKAHTDSPKE